MKGFDELGNSLPKNDSAPYTPVMKYVWDKAYPSLQQADKEKYDAAVATREQLPERIIFSVLIICSFLLFSTTI